MKILKSKYIHVIIILISLVVAVSTALVLAGTTVYSRNWAGYSLYYGSPPSDFVWGGEATSVVQKVKLPDQYNPSDTIVILVTL